MYLYMTIYWTSEDCHGQAILTLHLSVGQVIIFPYFDHCILLDNLQHGNDQVSSQLYQVVGRIFRFP